MSDRPDLPQPSIPIGRFHQNPPHPRQSLLAFSIHLTPQPSFCSLAINSHLPKSYTKLSPISLPHSKTPLQPLQGSPYPSFVCVCVCVCFLGLHLWPMEVPRLGVESEPQVLAYTTATAMLDPSFVCDLHPQLTATPDP